MQPVSADLAAPVQARMLLTREKTKMVDIDARAVFADVMQVESFGDGAELLLPEDAVERTYFAVAIFPRVALPAVNLPFIAWRHGRRRFV